MKMPQEDNEKKNFTFISYPGITLSVDTSKAKNEKERIAIIDNYNDVLASISEDFDRLIAEGNYVYV
jgi:hypothetical protein